MTAPRPGRTHRGQRSGRRLARVAGLGLATGAGCHAPVRLDAERLSQSLAEETRQFFAEAGSVAPTLGTPPPTSPLALTESQAVTLALGHNPDLRALRPLVRAADGRVLTAATLANPTVQLQVLHLQELRDRPLAWAVEASWDPPQPVVRKAAIAAARADAEATRLDLSELELGVAYAVRAAHATLRGLAAERRIIEDGLALRRRILSLVERRVQGGVATRVDLGLAALSVTQAERDRDELRSRETTARAGLRTLLGVDASPTAEGPLPRPPTEVPPTAALEAEALRHRPGLAAEIERHAARDADLRAEQARRWPWLQLTMAPRYRANDSRERPDDWGFGLRLSVPIFDLRAGPIRVAEARRDQAEAQSRAALLALRADLAAAEEELHLRLDTLARHERVVEPALVEQQKVLDLAMSGGQLDVVAVLNAEEALLRARRDGPVQAVQAYRAWLALARTVGLRDPAAVGPPGPATAP